MTISADGVGLPVFGDEPPKRHRFALAVWSRREVGKKLRVEEFTAWELDGAGLVLISRAAPDQVASAVMEVLASALDDDDGLSDTYTPPDDDEVREQKEADETVEQARERLTDPRLDDRSQWSSRRRFYAILDNDEEQLHRDALPNLGRRLLEEEGGFPTANSSRSSAGRRRSGRGSGGRR
jgi:hypothetical protein